FGVCVERVDALREMREALLHEWDEATRRSWFQKQRTPPYSRRTGAMRPANYALDCRGLVGESRNHRHHEHVAFDSSAREFEQRAQTESRPRRARLQDSLQPAIERYQRKVHRQLRAPIDFFEQLEVANDKARLGRDREVQSRELREHFEHRARESIFSLGRLIRIGRGANRDRVSANRGARESAPKHLGRHPLDENLALEIHRIAQLEKFVGVSRVAVNASELATAIRIDRPPERHPWTVASIEDLPHRHLNEFDTAARGQVFQLWRVEGQSGGGFHKHSFAFSSLDVKAG